MLDILKLIAVLYAFLILFFTISGGLVAVKVFSNSAKQPREMLVVKSFFAGVLIGAFIGILIPIALLCILVDQIAPDPNQYYNPL